MSRRCELANVGQSISTLTLCSPTKRSKTQIWLTFVDLPETALAVDSAASINSVVTETVITERRNHIVKAMAAIYEHTIHRFLRERGGSASKREIYRALGDDVESRQMIDEKLRMMERFGLVDIDGEEVNIK